MTIKRTARPVWWSWFFGLALGLLTLVVLGQPEMIVPCLTWWSFGATSALICGGFRVKRRRRVLAQHPEPLPDGYELYPRYSEFSAKIGDRDVWSAEVLQPKAMGAANEYSYYYQPPSGGPYHERGVSTGKGRTADEACRNAILAFQSAERLKQEIAGETEIAKMVWAPGSAGIDRD